MDLVGTDEVSRKSVVVLPLTSMTVTFVFSVFGHGLQTWKPELESRVRTTNLKTIRCLSGTKTVSIGGSGSPQWTLPLPTRASPCTHN